MWAVVLLAADLADLDLIAFHGDPIVVARRRMDRFAQEQVHAPMTPRIWPIGKPPRLGAGARDGAPACEPLLSLVDDVAHGPPGHPAQAGHYDANEAHSNRFNDVCHPREAQKDENRYRTSDQKYADNSITDSTQDVA